jgi:hypothetical protein
VSKIMKYFTPELLARFRSADDDVADAAAEEWARAQARYERYLKDHREGFPSGVLTLLDGPPLHDAALVVEQFDVGCALALRLGDGLGDLVVISYFRGVGRKEMSPLPELADKVTPPRVLYDEVRTLPLDARLPFRHSLLCTGGLMVQIDFADVLATRVGPSQLWAPADKWTA